jgi:Flp pilus assembly protein TadG
MRGGRRGNTILETMIWLPILLLLLVGMVQIGKITYVYYTLKKTLYTVAAYLATQQGVDFCSDQSDAITQAKNLALTGNTDGSAESFLPALTADMIQVTAECIDPSSNAVGNCSTAGCGAAAGGPHPDFIVVSIPDGYTVAPRFPHMLVDPIPLKPEIRVPFGGT